MDMEWNRAKSKNKMITSPIKLSGEIIQIGAVKLDDNLQIVDTFNEIIKPVFYKTMNKEVEKVTFITDRDIESGKSFQSAVHSFKDWCGTNDIILTWGHHDIKTLVDNLTIHGLETDWIPENYDAQWMFDDQITMEGRRYSLDYARYIFNVKGRNAHNALNDAANTAEVIQHLNVAEWIAEERKYNQEKAVS